MIENNKVDGKFLVNKKAQGLSITTIILIILGVVILVVLIFGFTQGWDSIKGWVAPSDNVEDVVSACSVACASDQVYDFCIKNMTLKADSITGTNNEKKGSCNFFSNDSTYTGFGIAKCPSITCS